jgi:thiamine biosynthesis lipoprotein
MSLPHTVALARQAMATRFEIVLHGEDPVSLRAAGEEALDEIERLDRQLNLYSTTSEIARLNARAAREPMRVEPGLFHLLEQARKIHQETGGAFDITIGPLMRCWGFMGHGGAVPHPDALAEARARTGMHLVELNAKELTVRFARDGVMLDLGAIGKGYAIQRAAELLREARVPAAILHGGTSTVCALGHPPGAAAWKVAVACPEDGQSAIQPVPSNKPTQRTGAPSLTASAADPAQDSVEAKLGLLAILPLNNEALSVSAVWGKSFQSGNKTYGHVLDPRTGQPAFRALLAAVAHTSATETDALSTALLTVGSAGHDAISRLRPGLRTLVVEPGTGSNPFQVRARGIEIRPPLK